MSECDNKFECPCTYSCPRHAKCCECVENHLKSSGFPACFFSEEAEKQYDRSFDMLLRDRQG